MKERLARGHDTGLVSTEANFWPSFVDVITTVLMFVMLANLGLITLLGDPESEAIRRARDQMWHAMESRLSSVPHGRQVSFEARPNLLQIRFSEEVLFDTKDYLLKPRGRALLAACAEVLLDAAMPRCDQIQIEGHTDDAILKGVTYPKDNWELSTARALSVLRYLVEMGIPERIMSANGYAEHRPVRAGDSPEARSLNRRVELRVVFSAPDAVRGH